MIGLLGAQSGFKAVGNEVRNVTKNVGLLDMTAFAKCRISGPGAENFLDYLVANRIPNKIGQIGLCHALNSQGGIHSEFTILKRVSRFLLFGICWSAAKTGS